MPSAALSVVMCGAVMAVGAWLPAISVWGKLAVQILCGAAVYVALAALFKMESFCFLLDMVKSRRGQKL